MADGEWLGSMPDGSTINHGHQPLATSHDSAVPYRAVSIWRADGALWLPARSTATIAYTCEMPPATLSVKCVSLIGVGVIGSSGIESIAPSCGVPRSTMYPARSLSLFGSQIRLIAPALAIVLKPEGAAGANVSTSVVQSGGPASLSIVALAARTVARTV